MADSIVKRSFYLNIEILKISGLYPTKNSSFLYTLYAFFLMILCLIMDPALCGIKIYQNPSLMKDNFDLFVLGAMLTFVTKFSPFILNYKNIQKCINFLDTIPLPIKENQRKIIEDCVRVNRRNAQFFFWFELFNSGSWAFRPLLLFKELVLPMDVWLPFNATDNFLVFCIIYIAISMGVVYCAFVTAAVDCTISGLEYHISGQIRILKDNLQHLEEDAEEEIKQIQYSNSESKTKAEIIYENIKKCIQHHSIILSFKKEVESSFSVVVFSQFMGSTAIICFSCFQLVKLDPKSFSFMAMASYFWFLVLQLYFYCFYGTLIYDENESVTTAAYMGPWYNYNAKCKKALLILMNRANIPLKITVGKLLGCSLDTFTMIFRRSYSLLAVLRSY